MKRFCFFGLLCVLAMGAAPGNLVCGGGCPNISGSGLGVPDFSCRKKGPSYSATGHRTTFTVWIEGTYAAVGTCTEVELADTLHVWVYDLCRAVTGRAAFTILPGAQSKMVFPSELRIEGTIRCAEGTEPVEQEMFAKAIKRRDTSPSKYGTDACVSWRSELHAAKTADAKTAVVKRRPDGC